MKKNGLLLSWNSGRERVEEYLGPASLDQVDIWGIVLIFLMVEVKRIQNYGRQKFCSCSECEWKDEKSEGKLIFFQYMDVIPPHYD